MVEDALPLEEQEAPFGGVDFDGLVGAFDVDDESLVLFLVAFVWYCRGEVVWRWALWSFLQLDGWVDSVYGAAQDEAVVSVWVRGDA